MSWITARRRRPAAGYAVLLLGLVLAGVAYAAVTSAGNAAAASPGVSSAGAQSGPDSSSSLAMGKNLFLTTCASCHGFDAQGTSSAPSLIGVGAAAVDFQVSTGRMPARDIGPQMARKPPVLNPTQTRDVANYIQSLGGGPLIPTATQVNTQGASLALGQSLFITDCAQCHNFSGAGGALTYGKYAPALTQATPTQIYEAMQTGPEAMPNFNELPPSQKRDVIDYVTTVRSEANPGGLSLGRVGPVTEGIVGFLAGIGVLIFAAMWLTMKRRES